MSANSTRGSSRKPAGNVHDPENPPLTPEQCAQMRPVAVTKLVREKLRMSRDEFAAAYGIPLDTLAAWERRTAEPSEAELAFLRVIEREPELTKMVPAE